VLVPPPVIFSLIGGTLIDATKDKELTDNRGTDCCRCGLTVLGDS
jgi:hypothetical protein